MSENRKSAALAALLTAADAISDTLGAIEALKNEEPTTQTQDRHHLLQDQLLAARARYDAAHKITFESQSKTTTDSSARVDKNSKDQSQDNPPQEFGKKPSLFHSTPMDTASHTHPTADEPNQLPFTTQKKRRNTLQTTKPSKHTRPEIEINNKFNVLEPDADLEVLPPEQAPSNATSIGTLPNPSDNVPGPSNTHHKQTLQNTIPPIFIKPTHNWTTLLKDIQTQLGPDNINSKLNGDLIKINVKSSDNYRDLTTFLNNNNIEYHSYSLRNQRPLKLLIRGIPTNTNMEDIKTDLLSKGYTITSIANLKKGQGIPMPLYYIQIMPQPNIQDIYQLDTIFNLHVTIEPYNTKHLIKQCHRCQAFGHSSHLCHMMPRCVKCGENHITNECTKPADTPAVCCNCGGPHPASYRGCPKAPTPFSRSPKSYSTKQTTKASPPPPPQDTLNFPPLNPQQNKPTTSNWSKHTQHNNKPQNKNTSHTDETGSDLKDIINFLKNINLHKTLELIKSAFAAAKTKNNILDKILVFIELADTLLNNTN